MIAQVLYGGVLPENIPIENVTIWPKPYAIPQGHVVIGWDVEDELDPKEPILCSSCRQWHPLKDIYIKQDGKLGKLCIPCTERNNRQRKKKKEAAK